MIYYPIGLTASLSLVRGLRNPFHTRLLSASFELLRQKHFLLFLLKPSWLLSPSSCFGLCLFLPLCQRWEVICLLPLSLSLLNVLKGWATSTAPASIIPSNSSMLCNLASALPLEWHGSSEIHQNPIIHHILWPSLRPCCGICPPGFSVSDYWPVPPSFSYSLWLVNAGTLRLLPLDHCSSSWAPVELPHFPLLELFLL